jgi:hypothetical protein
MADAATPANTTSAPAVRALKTFSQKARERARIT